MKRGWAGPGLRQPAVGFVLPLLLALLLLMQPLALTAWIQLRWQQRQAGLAAPRSQSSLSAESALGRAQSWLCRQTQPPPPQRCRGPLVDAPRVCDAELLQPEQAGDWGGASRLALDPGSGIDPPLFHIAVLAAVAGPQRYRISALGRATGSQSVLQRDIAGFGPGCRHLASWLRQ